MYVPNIFVYTCMHHVNYSLNKSINAYQCIRPYNYTVAMHALQLESFGWQSSAVIYEKYSWLPL